MKRVVLAVVLSMSVCFAVRAENAANEANKDAVLEEARQHVAKAKVHYDLGEFKQAADEYTLVYRLRPIPALLFNIAQAYRQAGLYDKAKSFYRSYLREVPDAKNKASIEASIREMDQLLAKEKKTREAPPSGVKEPAEASLPIKTAGKAGAPAAKPGATQPAARPAVPSEWAAKSAEKAPEKTASAPQKPAAATATATPAQPAPAKVAVATTPAPASSPWAASPQAARAPAGATSGTPAPAVVESDSILKKWWLWTAVGVVAVGAGAAAMTMGGNSAPGSHYGTQPVFP